MDELIEQVKRAMYEASPRLIFDEDGSTIGHVPWEEFTPAPFTWEGNDDLAIAAIRAVREYDVKHGPLLREFIAAREVMFHATGGNLVAMDAAFNGLRAAAVVRRDEPDPDEPRRGGDPMFSGLLKHLVEQQDAAAAERARVAEEVG